MMPKELEGEPHSVWNPVTKAINKKKVFYWTAAWWIKMEIRNALFIVWNSTSIHYLMISIYNKNSDEY